MSPSKCLLPAAFAFCVLQASAHTIAFTDDVPAKEINYSDLNLQKSADVGRLYGRIKVAASSVCRSLAGPDVARTAHFNRCVDEAVARAVADVDSPLLTEHYATTAKGRILSPLVSRLNR